MVPKAGLEPARPYGQQILSLLRLPIPSFGHMNINRLEFNQHLRTPAYGIFARAVTARL